MPTHNAHKELKRVLLKKREMQRKRQKTERGGTEGLKERKKEDKKTEDAERIEELEAELADLRKIHHNTLETAKYNLDEAALGAAKARSDARLQLRAIATGMIQHLLYQLNYITRQFSNGGPFAESTAEYQKALVSQLRTMKVTPQEMLERLGSKKDEEWEMYAAFRDYMKVEDTHGEEDEAKETDEEEEGLGEDELMEMSMQLDAMEEDADGEEMEMWGDEDSLDTSSDSETETEKDEDEGKDGDSE